MKRIYLSFVLIPFILASCSSANNIVINQSDPNTLEPIKNEKYEPLVKPEKNNTLEDKNVLNSQNTSSSVQTDKINDEQNNDNLNLQLEQTNSFSTNLNSNQDTSSQTASKLVVKPAENVDPSTLVVKPDENVDPSKLVVKPAENVDPDKIASIETGLGFTNINFSQGTNEIQLNVELSEFKALSNATATSDYLSTIDVLIRLNGGPSQTVSIDSAVFDTKPFLLVYIKGLKNLENINVELIGKNKDKGIISSKQVLNDTLKGNKIISAIFYRGSKDSANNQNSNLNQQ